MTGIFLVIIPGAAAEQMARGELLVAPYWRVIEEDGRLWEKTPFGAEQQAACLREEGVEILAGKTVTVANHKVRLL